MRFNQDFIEKVRQANDLGEIIGQYTELKGTHRLTGRCPFPDHQDKSPSFSVNEDKQVYYCFGCKKSGNAYTFLQEFNGMSFPEAVEYLARRSNIPLPEPDERERKAPGSLSSDQKDLLLKVNRATAVYFHHNLKAAVPESPVRKYLAKRGLTDEIVEKFRLGYSTDEWQGLGRHLVGKGVPIDAIEKLQLIKQKKSTGGLTGIDKYFDLFRDRLMFPIFGPNGDTLGFGGRVLDDGLPKYINSSDSPVFHKGRVLYGLHETGKFIRAFDEVIVVEGYMDAIALYVAGFKNVVAILGTAMTHDHAKLLKRYTLNVKMLLDGDEAGINAAEKSLPVLLAGGLMPKGLILPDKLDPDEFIRERGVEAMRAELDRAPELFNVLLSKRWLANYHGSDSEKVQVVGEAAVALGQMSNRALGDLYMLELARYLDVDIGWVRRAISQAVQANAPRVIAPQTSSPAAPSPRPAGAASRPVSAASRPVGGVPSRPSVAPAPSRPVSGASSRPTGSQSPVPAGSRPAATGGARPFANDDLPPDFDFAPIDGEFSMAPADSDASPHLGGDEASGLDPQELTDSSPAVVSLKGAPKDEAFVMSLLLYNEKLMRELMEAEPDEVLKMISHPGVREILKRAVDRIKAGTSFSTLAPLLVNEVDQPSVLASSLPLTANLTAEDAEKKLMGDYLNAIRKRFMKSQAKTLISQLRERPTAEMLEQVQQLQRNRLGKDDSDR